MGNLNKTKKIFTGSGGGGSGSTTINSVGTGTSLVVAPDNVKSLKVVGDLTITDNGNDVTITNTAQKFTVVANYSALPDPTTVSGKFYWVSASQGTKWLPGSLGGTFYDSGVYYSNGTTWEYTDIPYNATQTEVNTGTNNDKFVTPSTLTNATVITNKGLLANPLSQFAATTSAQLASIISDETGSGGALVFATGPTLSNPVVGTQSANDNSTKAASTAYTDAKVADAINDSITTIAPSQNAVFDALVLKANLASPALTGTPTAPTAANGTSTTQLATTAFVQQELIGSEEQYALVAAFRYLTGN